MSMTHTAARVLHDPSGGLVHLNNRYQRCMLMCMQSTSVRIDEGTHVELKRLAAEMGETVGRTVTLAVRALRQDQIGADLAAELTEAEVGWLDAPVR